MPEVNLVMSVEIEEDEAEVVLEDLIERLTQRLEYWCLEDAVVKVQAIHQF